MVCAVASFVVKLNAAGAFFPAKVAVCAVFGETVEGNDPPTWI
jgi:hypothetical protein